MSLVDFLKENDIKAEILVDSRVENYIRDMGTVTKSEVYRWSMSMKIAPVVLYNTLRRLEKTGKLRRYFDESKEDLVYVYVKD